MTEGSDFIVEFTVGGLPVIGLNAGPDFTLNEAFSFYLSVDTQDEVDHFWELLTADGGEPGACGWCKDKFGVSWQVIPKRLEELSGDYSTDANKRAMNAMLQMHKIDIAAIERAHAGEDSPAPTGAEHRKITQVTGGPHPGFAGPNRNGSPSGSRPEVTTSSPDP